MSFFLVFSLFPIFLFVLFFFGTGFHGFHVFVGLLLLILCHVMRLYLINNISFYLNCALLYWHFVDVIWLFLFSFIYILSIIYFCFNNNFFNILFVF